MDADPSKSKGNYQYKTFVDVIKSVKLQKYRKDNGELLEGVSAHIIFDRKSKLYLLVIKTLVVGQSIYTGILVPSKSTHRILNHKT